MIAPTRLARGLTRLRAAAVTVLGALIVGLPALALDDDPPARFGWQMYGRYSELPDYFLAFSDGRTSVVEGLEIVAGARSDLDYVQPSIEWICGAYDGVWAVSPIINDRTEAAVLCVH